MQNTAWIKVRILTITLIMGILLMGVKFLAWYMTNSNAILTDAMESVVNVVAGGFALYSAYYALKPKDKDHPYGHGKIEFLSAGFEGGMILLAGIAMFIKGIVAFFHRDQVGHADLGAYLSALAGAVNFVMGKYLVKKGKEYHSSLMIADGKHLISDTVSSIGLVLGLFVIFITGISWIDYVITLIFGAYIIYTGFKLVSESVGNLLDKADEEKIARLVDLLNEHRREKWIDIHNLRVLKYGSHLHVDCHMTLPWYDPLEATHEEVSLVEKLVRENMGQEVEFFIHADPCLPISCPICSVSDCPYRKATFTRKIDWTAENLQPDQKHQL
jgi:cation diffusion facilitator family transporter